MGVPETILINDLSVESGPMSMDAIIDHQVEVRLGHLAAAGPVFRKATPEEAAAFQQRSPEAYQKLRENVEANLVERASWGTLPAGYEPLRAVEDTDAA